MFQVTEQIYLPARLPVKLLLTLASTVILGSESHGTLDHILLSEGSGSLPNQIFLHGNANFIIGETRAAERTSPYMTHKQSCRHTAGQAYSVIRVGI
jgi:hypothetical protein